MTKRKIIAHIDPFIYTQTIYVMDDVIDEQYTKDVKTEMIHIDTPKLAEDLVYFAYNSNIYNITFYGTKIYLNRLVSNMQKIAQSDFSDRHQLNIEIAEGEKK